MSAKGYTASNELLDHFDPEFAAPVNIKKNWLQSDEHLNHVIFSDQFDRGLLEHLCKLASMVKELRSDKEGARNLKNLIFNQGAELYFTQSSTRTFKSFEKACHILGMETSVTRDTKLSSEYKGESVLDSIRMYSSYADILIIRSEIPKLAEAAAYLMNNLSQERQRNIPIINAGSGADEHPTQALLDMYTIYRNFEFASPDSPYELRKFEALAKKYPELGRKGPGPDNKVYGFCGDVGRGRTIRSLSTMLARNYENITMYFISPDHEKLKIPKELKTHLINQGVELHEVNDLASVAPELDTLYMTRIQHEHDNESDKKSIQGSDLEKCYLSEEILATMKKYARIMHPFPRNYEIPTEIDTDERVVYFRQARNGLWVRTALIAYLLRQDTRIMNIHADFSKESHNYNESMLRH